MMSRRCVYVVDDEEPIRRSLKLMLTVQGHQVTAFESGSALLHVADALLPGCILLDIRMPDMDGIEVLRRLRHRGAGLPVIVMTGHGDLTVAASAFREGAIHFIEKPFSKTAVGEALNIAFLALEEPEAYRAGLETSAGRVAALSDEERAVLGGLTDGHSNELIASEFGMAIGEVELSRARIFSGLGVDSLPAVLRLAFAAGLRPPDP
jgi:two-component system, LuxR family, response regulator FixJ